MPVEEQCNTQRGFSFLLLQKLYLKVRHGRNTVWLNSGEPTNVFDKNLKKKRGRILRVKHFAPWITILTVGSRAAVLCKSLQIW